jgi:hypothetical protein
MKAKKDLNELMWIAGIFVDEGQPKGRPLAVQALRESQQCRGQVVSIVIAMLYRRCNGI